MFPEEPNKVVKLKLFTAANCLQSLKTILFVIKNI